MPKSRKYRYQSSSAYPIPMIVIEAQRLIERTLTEAQGKGFVAIDVQKPLFPSEACSPNRFVRRLTRLPSVASVL
jgi:hypothetical protein